MQRDDVDFERISKIVLEISMGGGEINKLRNKKDDEGEILWIRKK